MRRWSVSCLQRPSSCPRPQAEQAALDAENERREELFAFAEEVFTFLEGPDVVFGERKELRELRSEVVASQDVFAAHMAEALRRLASASASAIRGQDRPQTPSANSSSMAKAVDEVLGNWQ